jgi:Pyruvate/2-oxoacid:ferredoxin oxidoreductase gamma subunit
MNYMVSLVLMYVTRHNNYSFLQGKFLSNKSIKPEKLKEHLKSVHPENASKDAGIFSFEES